MSDPWTEGKTRLSSKGTSISKNTGPRYLKSATTIFLSQAYLRNQKETFGSKLML